MILTTLRAGMKLKHGLVALLLGLLAISALAQDATPAATDENPAVSSEQLQTTPAVPADKPAGTETPTTPSTPDSDTAAPASTEATGDNAPAATDSTSTPAEPSSDASATPEFKTLDQDVQSLKKDVLDLNRELFVLEEELLYPADTQVAFFVSMDVGTFFALDTVTLKIDNKEVANYLYTTRETQALLKGGVQRVYVGNLKVGEHELVAFFTGKGPHQQDYKRGATLKFTKGVGAKYLELKISDKQIKEQPEFIIKEWD